MRLPFPLRSHSPLLALLAALCLSPLAQADVYYRWIGEDGVTHYGSHPPEGVQAEKVDTYGRSNKNKSKESNTVETNPGSPSAGTPSTVSDTQRQQLADQRKQQCEDERQRLQTLRSTGTRIRMKQEDGSARFLTPEEIAKEISTSQEFIDQACQ